MRPRLASLPLLLLALCRTSFGNSQPMDNKRTTAASTKPDSPDLPVDMSMKAFEDIVKQRGGYAINVLFFALTLGEQTAKGKGTGSVPADEQFRQNAIDNGILCAYDDEKLADDIKKAVYGNKTINEMKEKKWWKATVNRDINCAVQNKTGTSGRTVVEQCFCEKKRTLAYCAGLGYKETIKAPKGACLKEALTALEGAGSGEMAKVFDYEKSYKDFDYNTFALESVSSTHPHRLVIDLLSKRTEYSIDALAKSGEKFFCDAVNPEVETKVKALLATDGYYYYDEKIVRKQALGPRSFTALCKEDEFNASDLGKCACARDMGFSFCVYKAVAMDFQKQNYLDCTAGAEKFDPAKKPEAAPQLWGAPTSSAPSALLSLSAAAALLLLRY